MFIVPAWVYMFVQSSSSVRFKFIRNILLGNGYYYSLDVWICKWQYIHGADDGMSVYLVSVISFVNISNNKVKKEK